MSLQDDLQEINGIGEAKSAEIVEIVESHTHADATGHIQDALDALDNGRADMAESYLRAALAD